MHVTERVVAKLYTRYQQAISPKEKVLIFRQFQHAESIIFGHHLSELELKTKVDEWKKKGYFQSEEANKPQLKKGIPSKLPVQ